ncbi:MAG: energy transducer TonB [Gemmatimonadota bacterium]|nr:energy transducer TonB [Gemmatimonadota bacterium]MDH5804401.1 energy transducer TonB [Gemmatimonadota bacterium]
MRYGLLITALLFGSCTPTPNADDPETPHTGFEPPVVTNSESPVAYPPQLFEQGVEGTVMLHLFIDENGAIVPESTRVVESSGVATLDSAALAGAGDFSFAPALQDGQPVAAAFLQPVHFRRPGEPSEGENQ